ncbi:MAG: peptide deformylase [Patescibacteria group bacterium]|nr:peptide deformylase [Patescibacteria group bacterium]MDD5294406.1 peptide deformylase [Patescibacteria group bacterium]MDD5554968.1 peptide deformylase [Patescibacteria group bacterium]
MAKILPIIKNPSPLLREKSKEIDFEKIKPNELKDLCADMIKTMKEKDGVGLAAPQVGKSIRLITINTKDGPKIMINPKITNKSWAKEWNEEGCLSVPGVYGKVRRNKKINCVYFDKNGQKIKIQAQGLLSFVIQHETDHLDGILFIDKAKEVKKIKAI